MTLPRSVARFSQRYINPLTGPLIRWVPGFIEVGHRGRRTGTGYTTPLFGFGADQRWLVSLSYGTTADWLLNAQVYPATIRSGRSTRTVSQITVRARTEVKQLLPLPVRAFLKLAKIEELAEIECVE